MFGMKKAKKELKVMRENLETKAKEYISLIEIREKELANQKERLEAEKKEINDMYSKLQEQDSLVDSKKQSIDTLLKNFEMQNTKNELIQNAFSEIEKRYQSTIDSLKTENKKLLEKKCSLEDYAKEISVGKSDFIKKFNEDFARNLEDLGIYASSYEPAYLGKNSYFSLGYDTRISMLFLSNDSMYGKSYKIFRPNAACSDNIALVVNTGNLPYMKEILEQKELDDIIQMKFFKILLERRDYTGARSLAEICMNKDNEEKYISILQQYRNDHHVNEAFQNLKPRGGDYTESKRKL